MKQHVSIARALKEKSRIAGRIHTLTDVINHENDIRVNYELTRLSTFDPGFKFFRGDNLQNAACGAGIMRLSPRKAV